MNVKFSEDIIPLSSVKMNPGKLVRQAGETHRPLLLTSRSKGVAVIQSLEDFEKVAEECEFMRAVMQGSVEIDAGKGIALSDVKERLGL